MLSFKGTHFFLLLNVSNGCLHVSKGGLFKGAFSGVALLIWFFPVLHPQERKKKIALCGLSGVFYQLKCSFWTLITSLFSVLWLSWIRNNWVIYKIDLKCGFLFRCSTADSRLAAYEVLVMLADSSPSNLQLITKELLSMHHQCDPALTKEFDVSKKLFLVCISVFWNAVYDPVSLLHSWNFRGLQFKMTKRRWE